MRHPNACSLLPRAGNSGNSVIPEPRIERPNDVIVAVGVAGSRNSFFFMCIFFAHSCALPFLRTPRSARAPGTHATTSSPRSPHQPANHRRRLNGKPAIHRPWPWSLPSCSTAPVRIAVFEELAASLCSQIDLAPPHRGLGEQRQAVRHRARAGTPCTSPPPTGSKRRAWRTGSPGWARRCVRRRTGARRCGG